MRRNLYILPQCTFLLFIILLVNGCSLHEEPEIPNYHKWRRGIKLQPGMTFAIEPMINIGSPNVVWMDDEWTVVTEDESLSAHYENTIIITDGRPEILTLTESEKHLWTN